MPLKRKRNQRTEDYSQVRTATSSSSQGWRRGSTLPSAKSIFSKENPSNWTFMMLPFVLHIILSILIGAFLLGYINQNHFNIASRRPTFTDLNDVTHHMNEYRLLQTDITTILSISLSILRTMSGTWYAATCWRCAIILLELEGMSLSDLRWMLNTSLPAMLRSPRPKSGNTRIVLLAAFVLLIALPAQYAAPILTGSVNWGAGHYLIPVNTSLSLVDTYVAAGGHTGDSYDPRVDESEAAWEWYYYRSLTTDRYFMAMRAMALGLGGWNDDPTSYGLLKRPFFKSSRTGNMTATNITLPYFNVDSVEWVTNLTNLPESVLSAVLPLSGTMNLTQPLNPLWVYGSNNPLAITFNTPWDDEDPQTNTTGPISGIPDPAKNESASGFLAVAVYWIPPNTTCGDPNNVGAYGAFGELPSNVALDVAAYSPLGTYKKCIAFANITYTAGVITCSPCQLEGGSWIMNISNSARSSTEVLPDPMVNQALRMIPETIQFMSLANTSIPQIWNNMENYSVEMLRRAYCASWTALSNYIGGKGPYVYSPAMITVPSSVATVSLLRVYIWFGLQALVMVSGLLFVMLQSMAKKPLVTDTAMEIFMLDTTEVKDEMDKPGFNDSELRRRGLLGLQKGDWGDYTTVTYEL